MSGNAAQSLELGAIRAALEERVRTPLGVLEVHDLEPFDRIEDARQRVEAVRQMRVLLSEQEPPPVEGAQDVRAALSLGEKGVMLEGTALRAIADTMRAGAHVRRQLLGYESKTPLLYGMAASLTDNLRLADHVTRCFDPDGQLADDASPDLGPLRKRVRSLREKIRENLTELLSAPDIQPFLQETYFTIRGDRYVLPIKASYKNEVKGIVHDASGSGQTVFIEPNALVDTGNRLKIAQSEQVEEEHRILSRLTELVVKEAESVREIMSVVGQLDLLASSARLAEDLGSAAIVPSDRPGFDLIEARHPLLLLQALAAAAARAAPRAPDAPVPPLPIEVVANELALKPEQQVLILTGPNTGGKTVAMKTAGLFAVMARAGLHLPCSERSTLGWFTRIEVVIGDEQSISSSLSTFAAHMKQLVETLARADERTLVLIDEIAADTDPSQGQALAQSILEALANRGAHVVVTTHFERLKAIPFADRRFRNAGVGFDSKSLRPTYKVTLDVPQSSSGLDIAQGLGLPPVIVDRARALMGEGTQALEKLMSELERRGSELALARRGAELAEREAAEEKQRLLSMQRGLEREREKLRDEARLELLKEIEAAREDVRKVVSRLQSATESQSAKDAMRAAQEATAALAKMKESEEAKLEEAMPPGAARPETLKHVAVGDWVHVKTIGKDGEVASIDGKEAQVAVGNLRMRVPLSALFSARTRRPKKGDRPEPGRMKKELADAHANRPVSGPAITEELDLRGHSIDESLDRLDAFLDHHYGTPITHVRVVHGHGTGALRLAIRAHLKASGYVRNIRPGQEHEGGDGATIVELA